MQKPTFSKPSTFIDGTAAMLLAGMTFLSPARAWQTSSQNDPQAASSPAQQSPPSSATQDSAATPTPTKPAAKMTPEAKHNPTATSKAKPSATAPATKPAATTGTQANDAAKPSSSGTAPATSTKQAATAGGQTGATKTAQTGAAQTGKAGVSRTSTAKSAAPLTLNTPKDKQSYAIGINVGKGLSQNLKQGGLDVDPAVLTRAIKDVLAGDKQSMTDQEAQATLTALQADMRKAQEEKAKQLSESNKKEGDEFLAANKTKEGVTTLPDGLQYKIVQEGTGPKPTAADSVTVNYRGALLNGTEFDSSYKRGQPATFNVGQIIKGWTEALQLMPVGSKWQIFIPSDLAYGPRGAGRDIGPNAALVFEVELLSIQPRPAAPAPPVAPATPPAPTAAPAASAPTTNPAQTPNPPAPKPTPPTPKSDQSPTPTPTPTPKPPTH